MTAVIEVSMPAYGMSAWSGYDNAVTMMAYFKLSTRIFQTGFQKTIAQYLLGGNATVPPAFLGLATCACIGTSLISGSRLG